MKALRIILFITGVALLFAGIWIQDYSTAGSAAQEFYQRARVCSPDWSGIEFLFLQLHNNYRTGLLLKLAGFGILYGLFFWHLYQCGNRHKSSITMPSILGVLSACCAAAFALQSPGVKYVEWSLWSFLSLGTSSVPFLHSVFWDGFIAASGALFLALALILIAPALFRSRRVNPAASSFPAVFPLLFLADGNPRRRLIVDEFTKLSFLELVWWEKVFAIIAGVFITIATVVFLKAFFIRKTRPDKAKMPAVILTVSTGAVVLVFWVLSIVNLCSFTAVLETTETPHLSDLAFFIEAALGSAFVLSIVLLTGCIIIPTSIALFLGQKWEEPREKKKPLLPLTALLIASVIFISAAFAGLYENPYKASLRRVVFAMRQDSSLEELEDDIARLESPEGLKFVKKSALHPQESYWNYFIMNYLWEHSRSPEATELFFELISDPSHPELADNGSWIVITSLERNDREKAEKLIDRHISKRPGCGGKIAALALETERLRAKFIHHIIKTCANAGENKFVIAKTNTKNGEDYEILEVPEGFTIHFNGTSKPEAGKFPVQLLYEGIIIDPVEGHAVLVADGRKFGYVRNRFGEMIPDYKEFNKILWKARLDAGASPGITRFLVELQVDPLVPAKHIRYALNECAKAGITEVIITKPR